MKKFVLFFLQVLFVLQIQTAFGTSVTVTNTTDTADTTNPDYPTSLRGAIDQLNQGVGGTINFNIPLDAGNPVIYLSAPLPVLAHYVQFNGPSQLAYNSSSPMVQIDGSGLLDGLVFNSGGWVDTVAITDFLGSGLILNSSVTVVGCYIGVNSDGVTAMGNGTGITINSSHSTIGGLDSQSLLLGGTSAAKMNVISGNYDAGIEVTGTAASFNLIDGNLIGTDAAGTDALPNQGDGVRFVNGAASNNLGGPSASYRNIVSGNLGFGFVSGSSGLANFIRNNYIGTDINGTASRPNGAGGVCIDHSTSVTVQGNVISGNSGPGIDILDGSTKTVVSGNIVGPDATGIALLANTGDGIVLGDTNPALPSVSGNTIGGLVVNGTASNVISGNGQNGINVINSSHDVVTGNFIGVDATGETAMGNLGAGILMTSTGVTVSSSIGAITAGSFNVISGNTLDGITLNGCSFVYVLGSNVIGMDITASVQLGNGGNGLSIVGGSNNYIGNASVTVRNYISGNTGSGIALASNSNTILGNIIGLDSTGYGGPGNGTDPTIDAGIFIVSGSNNVIGASTTGSSNIIAGNVGDGIALDGNQTTNNLVLGNWIGFAINGKDRLTNSQNGVGIYDGASNNRIGDIATQGNLIASVGDGVTVSGSASNFNRIRKNAIRMEMDSALQIDLIGGANQNISAPTLAITGSGTLISISAAYSGKASTAYALDVYHSDSNVVNPIPAFLQSLAFTTDAAGSASIKIPTSIIGNGQIYYATVVDGVGNTSQYSQGAVSPPRSSNSDLLALTLSSGTLSPVFTSSNTVYSASVANSVTAITATPTKADTRSAITVASVAVVSGKPSAAQALRVGANSIVVRVTAEDLTFKDYKITVTRAPSSNANLASLLFSGGAIAPALNVTGTSYTAKVAYTGTSATVTPTMADPYAKIAVRVNGGAYAAVNSGRASGALALHVGANPIDVQVTAQDGATVKTYTLTVTRTGSADATLSGLILSSGAVSPVFKPSTLAYSASVLNTGTSVSVTPVVNEPNATLAVRVNLGSYSPVVSGSASDFLPLKAGANTINIKVTAQDGVTVKTYTLTVTRAKNSNAFLSGLSLDNGVLTPFSSGTLIYTGTVASSITRVTATKADALANPVIQVRVNAGAYISAVSGSASGVLTLVRTGTNINTIDVKVTSEDGSVTNIYTMKLLRIQSDNADLLGLTLSAGPIAPLLTATNTLYTATVPYNVATVTVTPVKAEFDAKIGVRIRISGTEAFSSVVSGAASAPLVLRVGDTPIEVKVTAENGTTSKTYTLTVTRTPNASLAKLVFSGGTFTPALSLTGTSYTAKVAYTGTNGTVTPTVADPKAAVSVRINGGSYTPATSGVASSALTLNVGANPIDVQVTAQDGVTLKTYTLTVTRAGSSDATLSGLALSSGTFSPIFKPLTLAYTANVLNTGTSVTVTPVSNEPNASIAVRANLGAYSLVASGSASGLLPLKTGANTINIKVTAQDGITVKTYTVTVTRAP